MNLTKVLLPEILLGRRVRNELESKFYKLAVEGIEFTDSHVMVDATSPLWEIRHDVNSMSHFAMCRKFLEERPPVYHLCADFTKALLRLDDRQIPTHFMKDFFGYISFPKDIVGDGEEFIEGAFVFVGEATAQSALPPSDWGKRILWYTYTGQSTPTRAFLPNMGRACFELKEKTVADLVNSYIPTNISNGWALGEKGPVVKTIERTYQQIDITHLIVNTMLYLSSQDPVVMSLTPTFGKSHSQRKKYVIGQHENQCTIPVKAINWDYQIPREYTVDNTFVESFPRWQRCGPNFSQIKLIWVKEHTRHYHKHD